MSEPDRRPDPAATPPAGHVEETPEAAPLAPPAWRDQFADPILQRGQHYDPQARLAADAAPGSGSDPGSSANPGSDPAGPRPQPAPPPRAEPIVESVLEPGQVSREGLAQAARGFAEATPEQRAEQARQAATQARHLAERMRPLAADAATFAARALNLGARGLAGLAGRLADRRAQDDPPPK